MRFTHRWVGIWIFTTVNKRASKWSLFVEIFLKCLCYKLQSFALYFIRLAVKIGMRMICVNRQLFFSFHALTWTLNFTPIQGKILLILPQVLSEILPTMNLSHYWTDHTLFTDFEFSNFSSFSNSSNFSSFSILKWMCNTYDCVSFRIFCCKLCCCSHIGCMDA